MSLINKIDDWFCCLYYEHPMLTYLLLWIIWVIPCLIVVYFVYNWNIQPMIKGIVSVGGVLLCIGWLFAWYYYSKYKKALDHIKLFVDRVNEKYDDNIIAAQTRGYVDATRNLINWDFL